MLNFMVYFGYFFKYEELKCFICILNIFEYMWACSGSLLEPSVL